MCPVLEARAVPGNPLLFPVSRTQAQNCWLSMSCSCWVLLPGDQHRLITWYPETGTLTPEITVGESRPSSQALHDWVPTELLDRLCFCNYTTKYGVQLSRGWNTTRVSLSPCIGSRVHSASLPRYCAVLCEGTWYCTVQDYENGPRRATILEPSNPCQAERGWPCNNG
jgi:hypothetical protein